MLSQFNSLPLLSVKPGLDSSLANISRELERYFSEDDPQARTRAEEELHRIGGVLRMLTLTGLSVFCAEMEKLLREFGSAQDVAATPREALRRALFGLTHYLDALADGASNAVLRLYHEYQELLQARGVEMAFEVDLFFPSLQVDLPKALLLPAQDKNALARIRAARLQYQQALLKWLRQDGAAEALRTMLAAVRSVVLCVPQNQQRAFWWIASGLLDCLLHDGIPPELNVKKVLSRIDLKMKSLTDGAGIDDELALSEMLYLIARSHSVSDLVEKIKKTYELDAYLPEEQQMPQSETTALLDNMRVQLNVAREYWERCVAEDNQAYAAFATDMGKVQALSEQLDRNTLQFLSKLIHNTALQLRDQEQVQRASMDMAMALLLLDSGIEHYQHLGSGFQEQARILSTRLQNSLNRQPEDASRLSSLITLYCQMEQQEVMVPLAIEMQGNLQHIEQSLNVFFNHTAQRSALAQIGKLLSQVQGGFHILSLETAVQLVSQLRRVNERYVQGITPGVAEMRTVAAVVSALEEYTHGLVLGQMPHPGALDAALQDIGNVQEAPVVEVSPQPQEVLTPGVSVRSGGEDEELLEIFLEEAREVLDTLRSNLEVSRLHADSREPLVVMRRGFHTLKGSGRMVGLSELGEVAWAVERAMNKWLQENKPATPALLDMIGDAEVLFQHWVDMLRSGNTSATIDTSYLVTVANCIENGQEIPAPAAGQPLRAPVQPAEEATVEEPLVEIGSVSLSQTLFNIATEEAAGHVRALREQLAQLHETESHIVTYNFMRAAHTLAGVNRTMGFTAIAALAYALELWLEQRIDKPNTVSEQQIVLIDQAVSKLDEMCALVREQRREPQAEPDLVAALQANKEIASAVPAPEIMLPEAIAEQIDEPALTQAETTAVQEQAPSAGPAESGVPPVLPAESDKAATAAAGHAPRQQARNVYDEVDAQLLPIFLEEAHELYPQIGSNLRAWREQPGDAQRGRNLQRVLHTLKGSARMAGAMRLGELTHRVEDRVDQARQRGELHAEFWNELDNYLDRIGSAIEQLERPGSAETQRAEPAPEAAQRVQDAPVEQLKQTLEIGAERAMQAALLRVRSDTVDRLVNEAGEISVARSRAEMELREFKNNVLELTESVNRLRRQLREIEIHAEGQMQARISVSGDSAEKFDPLEFDRFTRFQELTRFMNESVHDVQTVQQTLLRNLAETEAALVAQSHLNRDLQQGLMAIRMVPFSSISERLYRIVRQTGKELNKRANLELSGTEVELDRSVLEKMTAPFEHLLRNAIAHGLEMPEQRARANKNPIGEISLSLRQQGNEVVFEFSDDGAGLDIASIRRKAVDSGVLREGEEISDEMAMQLIFTAGLSTADEVTEISGRGVGLDVVRSEITALGGRIDVTSQTGHGARFSIHLPLTLAVTKVLMVRSGLETYALPSNMVLHVQQLKANALDGVYHQQYIDWQGTRYPLHYLPRLLGDDVAEIVSQPHNPVLLLRAGDIRIALHVDELLGNQEAVVKNIGPQLARLPGIAGATVSGGGEVILIIDPIAFTQRIVTARKTAPVVVQDVHKLPIVMVVDDSLTVRKITSRLLARSGYVVVTAKDGVDALEQLTDVMPDVMLLDVEMPRMDGFELTKHLRQDARTRDLPIIMITSRTADKHRRYALELGVNEYMGKPYHEEDLLDNIARYTGTTMA